MTSRKDPPYFIQLVNAMDGSSLSLNARAVLVAQFKFGTHSNGRDSRVGEARLAEYLQTSVATIRRARKELRTGEWLILRKRGSNTGRVGEVASTYDIAIPPAKQPTKKVKRPPNNQEGFNAHKKRAEL